MSDQHRLKVNRSRNRLYQVDPNANLTTQAPLTITAPTANEQRQQRRALDTVQYHTAFASSIGILPFPLLDMAAISVLQLKLIRDLSRIYGVDFSRQRAKAAIAALVGGAQTGLVVSSSFKYIPLVGPIIAGMPAAAVAGATTYAMGQVFIYHYELGGTLLDFDAAKLKAYFRQQLSNQ